MGSDPVAVHWFRKGLRLHDNRALREASDGAKHLYPLFVVDSDPASPESRAGSLRTAFLLESLKDLDKQLRAKGSRLFVVRGRPEEELPKLFKEWDITKLTYEPDSEPRSRRRDEEIRKLAKDANVEVEPRGCSTLRDLERYVKLRGKRKDDYLKSYSGFLKLHDNAGPVPPCAPDIDGDLPPPASDPDDSSFERFAIPTFQDLEMDAPEKDLKHNGGETAALSRFKSVMWLKVDEMDLRFVVMYEIFDCVQRVPLAKCVSKERGAEREEWIFKFEKPKTRPNSLEPDTTALSMYLSHGCLSPRRFWHALCKVYDKRGGTKPPVSLQGQLLWREFNYFCAYSIPNFDRMLDNPVARQIPWGKDPEKLAAWREARTGYPFIDAIMTQLREEGWIHHLARHAVACFLTRGDLWQSWEEGAAVFDELLLDADWSVNNFNWQWLSCTAFFYQYFRCYSPVSFGKKTDKSGEYIKKYLPALKKFPSKYIYEPWEAPMEVQRGCKCIIGKDYPKPIVDHREACDENKGKLHDAYDDQEKAEATARAAAGDGGDDNEDMGDDEEGNNDDDGGKKANSDDENDSDRKSASGKREGKSSGGKRSSKKTKR